MIVIVSSTTTSCAGTVLHHRSPYYGAQPAAEKVAAIKAPLLLQYAGMDDNINKGIEAFEAALKATNKRYTKNMYEGTQHAFNNDTNDARYNRAAARPRFPSRSGFRTENTADELHRHRPGRTTIRIRSISALIALPLTVISASKVKRPDGSRPFKSR